MTPVTPDEKISGLRRLRRIFGAAARAIGSLTADTRLAADMETFHRLRQAPKEDGLLTLNVRFGKRPLRVRVRAGTSDVDLLRMIVKPDGEYALPFEVTPHVIFDVGANIGMTALYFACRYPTATIYCFEPVPENLALLRENARNFSDRIVVCPQALGAREGTFAFHPSDDPNNHGGGSFFASGTDGDTTFHLPMTTFDRACERFGVDRVDLLKLDVEGAERSVLEGMSARYLMELSGIIGELHGVDDWEVLQRLDRYFHVGFSKSCDRHCYPFHARRRPIRTPGSDQTERKPGGDRISALSESEAGAARAA